MEVYYAVVLFIFGTVLGSFYNVVGYRLPKGESIVSPPSHCPNCNHRLTPLELIPIFSFLFLGRKCRVCKQKISWFYMIFELITGTLFMVSYLIFGMSIELVLALTLISVLLIIIISDYQTLIIPDEVLIFGLIAMSIEIIIMKGIKGLLFSYLGGFIAFILMLLLKLFGDKVFKKESMGGGDIKLMFLIGMVLNWEGALISLFLASFIALPISLIILAIKKDHVIPFGPFLSIATIILFLTKFDINNLMNLLVK